MRVLFCREGNEDACGLDSHNTLRGAHNFSSVLYAQYEDYERDLQKENAMSLVEPLETLDVRAGSVVRVDWVSHADKPGHACLAWSSRASDIRNRKCVRVSMVGTWMHVGNREFASQSRSYVLAHRLILLQLHSASEVEQAHARALCRVRAYC